MKDCMQVSVGSKRGDIEPKRRKSATLPARGCHGLTAQPRHSFGPKAARGAGYCLVMGIFLSKYLFLCSLSVDAHIDA